MYSSFIAVQHFYYNNLLLTAWKDTRLSKSKDTTEQKNCCVLLVDFEEKKEVWKFSGLTEDTVVIYTLTSEEWRKTKYREN